MLPHRRAGGNADFRNRRPRTAANRSRPGAGRECCIEAERERRPRTPFSKTSQGAWRELAAVDRRDPALRGADHHEPAAANSGRVRINDAQPAAERPTTQTMQAHVTPEMTTSAVPSRSTSPPARALSSARATAAATDASQPRKAATMRGACAGYTAAIRAKGLPTHATRPHVRPVPSQARQRPCGLELGDHPLLDRGLGVVEDERERFPRTGSGG
jgi:hypothetical protein